MTAMQLLERLGVVEPIDPDLLERTACRLVEMVPASTETAPAHRRAPDRRAPGPRAPGPHGHRRIVPLGRVAAVAAVLTLVVVGSILVQRGTAPRRPGSTAVGTVPRHHPGAATGLKGLALVADAQPVPVVPGPGQYQYTSSVEAYTSETIDGPGKSYTVQVPENRQIWIGPDGSGRLLETFGTPTFLSAQDRADWVAAGSPALSSGPSDQTFGPGGLSDGPTDLTKLPTDPKALAAMISGRQIEGGPSGPAEDFTQVGDLLRETDAPPALRAALFTVTERIPGIEELGTILDHTGRTGVGIAFTSAGVRHELIFNPSDSTLMGEQDIVVGVSPQNEPVGTVVDWVVYLRSGVVDSDASGATSPSSTITR